MQVSQSQAIEGTPVDVPVPRKVSFMSSVIRPQDHFPFLICHLSFVIFRWQGGTSGNLSRMKWQMKDVK
jgi:hypothetical protein